MLNTSYVGLERQTWEPLLKFPGLNRIRRLIGHLRHQKHPGLPMRSSLETVSCWYGVSESPPATITPCFITKSFSYFLHGSLVSVGSKSNDPANRGMLRRRWSWSTPSLFWGDLTARKWEYHVNIMGYNVWVFLKTELIHGNVKSLHWE